MQPYRTRGWILHNCSVCIRFPQWRKGGKVTNSLSPRPFAIETIFKRRSKWRHDPIQREGWAMGKMIAQWMGMFVGLVGQCYVNGNLKFIDCFPSTHWTYVVQYWMSNAWMIVSCLCFLNIKHYYYRMDLCSTRRFSQELVGHFSGAPHGLWGCRFLVGKPFNWNSLY